MLLYHSCSKPWPSPPPSFQLHQAGPSPILNWRLRGCLPQAQHSTNSRMGTAQLSTGLCLPLPRPGSCVVLGPVQSIYSCSPIPTASRLCCSPIGGMITLPSLFPDHHHPPSSMGFQHSWGSHSDWQAEHGGELATSVFPFLWAKQQPCHCCHPPGPAPLAR